jgi:hypothetical protein
MLIVIRWESQIYKTPLAASKIKGTHIIVKIGYGRLCLVEDKGNNKITELRTILQRESQNS